MGVEYYNRAGESVTRRSNHSELKSTLLKMYQEAGGEYLLFDDILKRMKRVRDTAQLAVLYSIRTLVEDDLIRFKPSEYVKTGGGRWYRQADKYAHTLTPTGIKAVEAGYRGWLPDNRFFRGGIGYASRYIKAVKA